MTIEGDEPVDVAGTTIDARLLAVLVCPLTRMTLRYDSVAGELVNDPAGVAYPVRDGIPILLIEAAREL